MLSEKKSSNKGNDGDYFGELSKSFSNMYNSFQSNKPDNSIQEQVNNFAKSATDILGDTFNVSSAKFPQQQSVPNNAISIQENIPNVLSQGLTPGIQPVELPPPPGFTQPVELPALSQPALPQSPSIFPEEISLEAASKSFMDAVEKPAKSFMDVVEEPAKSFSGVFSAESAKSEMFKAPESSTLETIITIILLIVFIILILIYAIQYFYGIDIVAKIKNIFTNHPEVEITVEKEPEKKDAIDNDVSQILRKPQVFNIPENNYIYGDAQAVCKAYGARLATYQEVEEAYNKGAEWCNYGWSEGQMALFPTQQKTFDKLQTIEGHENDCGRPGVNGGFIDNPKLKYGVNCYGYKPRINKIEKEMMETSSIYPKTEKDIAMDKRVEYWKERLSEIIISPFNHDKWSKI